MPARIIDQAHEQAELERQQTESLYFSIFNNSPDAICLLGLDGKLFQANACAAELLGYAPTALINLTIHDLTANLDLTNDIFQRLLRGETISPYEQALKKKNGELLPVEIHPSLIRDRDGAPLNILSIFRDISERKRLENTARKSTELFRAGFQDSTAVKLLIDQDTGEIIDGNLETV
jgi:PAS domain S-box-containing protein